MTNYLVHKYLSSLQPEAQLRYLSRRAMVDILGCGL